MTERANEPPLYWYIRIPSTCPQPRFHFEQQVGIAGEDERGNRYYDIGKVIGMLYGSDNCLLEEWYYLVRYLKCDANPSFVGSDDGYFIEESALVADDTVLERKE